MSRPIATELRCLEFLYWAPLSRGTPCFFRQGIYTSSYHAPVVPLAKGDKAFGLSRNLLPPAPEKYYRDRSQADFEIEQ